MRLLVGIPAYDEAATIADVIARIPRTLEGIDQVDVVVVDDGSTDDTAALAAAAGAQVVRHRSNSGVGVAFQSIVRHALETSADLLVTIDGDGQFNPDDIAPLIEPILEGHAAVCTASRFLDPALVPRMPWVKKWGNHRVAQLVSALTGTRYADVSCGFRAYTREALLRLTVYHSFTYTHETFLDLAFKRIPIEEVPLEVRGTREFGASKVASSVLRYGWRTALIMLRTYRDQRPLRLFSVLAAVASVLGLALLGWSFARFLATGTWLKWAALTGAAGCAAALAIILVGFMADMTTRLRQNQEEILFWLRRQAVARPPTAEGADPVPPSEPPASAPPR